MEDALRRSECFAPAVTSCLITEFIRHINSKDSAFTTTADINHAVPITRLSRAARNSSATSSGIEHGRASTQARARGRKGGRPKKLSDQERTLAVDLYHQKKHGVDEICKALRISKPTLYAYVKGH